MEKNEFRGLLRLAGKDLKGELTLFEGLIRIRGIGSNLALALGNTICGELNIPKNTKLGDLSEEQTEKIDVILKSIPSHVLHYNLNRQRDLETGKNLHLLMGELSLAVRQDIQREKGLKTWRGWRHSIGQRVRGQRTRTTGRTGVTIGVLKKAIKEQQHKAAVDAQKKTEEKK